MFLVDSLRVCLGQYSQPACIRMRCRSTGGFCQSGGRRGHRQSGRTFGTFASCSCGENWVANEKMRHQIRDVRKHDVHTRQLRGERFLVWQAIGWTWVYQSVFNLVQEDQCQTERKNNQHMFILKHTCNFIFPVSWVFDVFGTQVYVLLGWCDKSMSRNHRTQSRHESSLWVFDLSNIIIHIQPPSPHPNSSIWCGLRSAASYGTSTVKPMSCEQARVPWKSCCSAKEKYSYWKNRWHSHPVAIMLVVVFYII